MYGGRACVGLDKKELNAFISGWILTYDLTSFYEFNARCATSYLSMFYYSLVELLRPYSLVELSLLSFILYFEVGPANSRWGFRAKS